MTGFFLIHSTRKVFRFEPLDPFEGCRAQPSNLTLTLLNSLLEAMSARSFESSSSSKDSGADCLKVCSGGVFQEQYLTGQQNYEIGGQIEGGGSPEVYLATCKRGRLKRRTVVLKRVPSPVNFGHVGTNIPSRCYQVVVTGRIQDSLAVHQALCHPTILSLFSTLSADSDPDEGDPRQLETPTALRYLVLEYCGPHGTLSDHLSRLNPTATSPLEENRIRGVVKTLADALVYLEKENVVHGKLVPESVYITEDFRVVSANWSSFRGLTVGLNWAVTETWGV